MSEFNIAFQKMLSHEGGYSKDPDDQGGETYKGISRVNHKNWLGWELIDRYKRKSGFPTSLENNLGLQKEVEQFYQTNFWNFLNGDAISNQTIADSILDFGVNAGIKTSIRLVQSVIGAKADGIVGEQTLNKLNTLDFSYIQAAFTITKLEYYIHIIKQRPTNKKYLYGWIIRALAYND